MDEFHVGPWMTAVGDGEILTEVRLPLRPGAGSAHEKVERRAGDWAIAAASAAVWLDGDTIADVGIGAQRRRPDDDRRSPAPRSCCAASVPSDELFEQAGAIASEDCSPIPDGRGPVDYKRHLAGVLTKRALRRADGPRAAAGGLNDAGHDHINGETGHARRRAAHAARPLHPRHARA